MQKINNSLMQRKQTKCWIEREREREGGGGAI